MTKKLWLILLFACAPLFAHAYEDFEEKTYISPEQIELHETLILVHINGTIVETDQLDVDQGGIYLSPESIRCTYCRKTLNPKNTCQTPHCLAKN